MFTAGVAYTNDTRLHMPGYQVSPDGYILFQPWQDGRLWPRSRFGGSEMAMGMLTEDFMYTGRWDTGPYTLGNPSLLKIIGTTRDANGDVLGSVTVRAYVTATDEYVGQVVSDSAGYFEVCSKYPSTNHYLLAYKSGSPDVAGTTKKTLTPT